MSAYEDSYKSQLQGVSQQLARERLDGQVTAQDNMLSDTVTNLRRRPGAAFAYFLSIPNATPDSILAWDTDLAGVRCHVVLNTVDGVVRLLNSTYAPLAVLPASTYLTTANPGDIQTATVGDEFFLCNTTKVPALGAPDSAVTPDKRGFYYVRAGAFSKTYDIRVSTAMGAKSYTYTTPNGTSAGDAALSTPEYIAQQFATAISADFALHGCIAVFDTSYVYVSTTSTGFAISTGSGLNYLVASGASYLRQEADLPSRLPAAADGYIISTGELRSLRYYKYDKTKLAWLECGSYNSALSITNVPVSITRIGGVWTLQTNTFEGRFAGDDTSNPDPAFVAQGITGMGNYQGRLVLLSGSLVNMSASAQPRRFYRSTVTAIVDSDCISVGAASASSAAYRYAVPFDKDLLLFSDKYQAVVPGSNTAITPRTASVVVTSTYQSDMTSKPVTCGRTVMYSAPRSADFFGLLEMVPSQYVDAKYISYDSTAHLPKYMAGRCRFSVSSSVANMVLFAPTNDRYALIVHEYFWQGDQKVQQSWHRWTFKYKVAAAYFSGQTIHVVFVNNGQLVACTIDPRSGVSNATSDRLAKLDLSDFTNVVNNVVAVPAWMYAFAPTALADMRLSVASGPLAGEPIGCTASGPTITTDVSFPNGRVAIGFPYLSVFSPSPPMHKDGNGVKVSSNKLTLLRFMVGTKDSAEYKVSIGDATGTSLADAGTGTLYYSSAELMPGAARSAKDSVAVIPARTNADTTSMVISTDGMGELNIVSLEYVARYHEKITRARKQ